MTGDEDARRPLDPVVAGLADGASAGYQALEHVVQGLREGLRRQAASPGAAPQATMGAPPAGGDPRFARAAAAQAASRAVSSGAQARPPRAIVDDMLGIVDELLGVASGMTRGLADLNRGRSDDTPADASSPFQVHLRARPGGRASGDFVIWNTGASMLAEVRFAATDLIGASGTIDMGAVGFAPEVARIAPGASAAITALVSVPPDAAPGRYHGCIQPTVRGTWAVVELDVAAL